MVASEVQELGAGDGGLFAFFTDPDGTYWAVQEMRRSFGECADADHTEAARSARYRCSGSLAVSRAARR